MMKEYKGKTTVTRSTLQKCTPRKCRTRKTNADTPFCQYVFDLSAQLPYSVLPASMQMQMCRNVINTILTFM